MLKIELSPNGYRASQYQEGVSFDLHLGQK